MKDPLDRTKVVLRHLPPTISSAVLTDQVDARFAGRYAWIVFRSGKASNKNMRYGRAYIEFKRPEDVLEFAEFFDGHIFVNEKGAQFKTLVEYAPSQRVPKPCSKDGREGTIFKDSEYLGFVEILAKPTENIPSAEIQLERKEAERAGGSKEPIIVTPLMHFVRQKRAARSGTQRASSSAKPKRGGGISNASSASLSHKKGHEKRRGSTSVVGKYVLRDIAKASSKKEKPSDMVAARNDEQCTADESVTLEAIPDENGAPAFADAGKKKVMLVKGKEKEVPMRSLDISPSEAAPPGSTSLRQNQRRDISRRIIRSILSNKEPRQNQTPEQVAGSHMERDKRPPHLDQSVSKDHVAVSISVAESDAKRMLDEKAITNDVPGHSTSDMPDRRTRNKDRPERGVWAPLRRPDECRTTDSSLSSASVLGRSPSELSNLSRASKRVVAGKHGSDELEVTSTKSGNQSLIKMKPRSQDAENQSIRLNRLALSSSYLSQNQSESKTDSAGTSRNEDAKAQLFDYASVMSTENGSHRCGRRGPITGSREFDGCPIATDGKPSKRGSPGFSAHERQIWVQKSGSGS